jgi:hypothetical protein
MSLGQKVEVASKLSNTLDEIQNELLNLPIHAAMNSNAQKREHIG